MSHPIGKTGSRVRTGGLVVLCLGVLLFLASALVPASGAYFFDSRGGTITANSATFGMTVSKADVPSVTAVNLTFKDLSPGKSAAESFSVKNTGSIAGVVTMYADNADLGGMSQTSYGNLTYTVNGRDNLSPITGARVALGTVQPGETKAVSVVANLSNSAGNEWQGKTVTSDLYLTMLQDQ